VQRGIGVVKKGRRVDRQLDDVVEVLGAVAHPQENSQLTKPPDGQPVTARQNHVVGLELMMDCSNLFAIARVSCVVSVIPFYYALIRESVHVVDWPGKWR
jgi:hypothetical protein